MANEIMDKAKELLNTPDTTAEYDAADIEQNKVMALLSYIWILFLVPLFMAKESRFARFHANQGIVLAIAGTALGIILGIAAFIPVVNIIVGILGGIVELAVLALAVFGIYNAVNGKAKELPLIGKFKILK